MSNLYCTDCSQYEDTFNENGAVGWCWRKNRELKCLELEIARNVPPEAYGYCRGFIPAGCDAIIDMNEEG